VEFYRERTTLLLGFTLGQLVALGMLLFGMFIFLIKKKSFLTFSKRETKNIK